MKKIPKVIHYFWFGNNDKPKIFYKCLESWKKYCPDYEIKEWNESNFDININQYVSDNLVHDIERLGGACDIISDLSVLDMEALPIRYLFVDYEFYEANE